MSFVAISTVLAVSLFQGHVAFQVIIIVQSVVRASDLVSGGPWVQFPSLTQFFFLISFLHTFNSPYLLFILLREYLHSLCDAVNSFVHFTCNFAMRSFSQFTNNKCLFLEFSLAHLLEHLTSVWKVVDSIQKTQKKFLIFFVYTYSVYYYH